MTYISITFLVFLVCLLCTYVLMPNQHKWKLLLIFSIIFYASNGLDKLFFILATSAVMYAVSRKIELIYQEFDTACQERQLTLSEKKELKQKYTRQSRYILYLALFVSVGILCYCKFGTIPLRFINHLAGTSITMRVIVPLGVSYYTFSSIAYLLDIHWRKNRAEKNYFRLLLCMIYFPHIVEGPISRYEKLLPQLHILKNPSYDQLCMGMQLMLWGYFKKLVIADRLAIFVNRVFGDIRGNEGLIFPIALIFGAFQIYTDFSGCMDIVTGVSDVIGIKLERNFNHPFLSRSVAEFWRRWHITLGNWFKDYIYVPITTSAITRTLRRQANKHFGLIGTKIVMTVVPLGAVWLLTGIWHGTGKNYVVWGIYWGFLIAISTLLEEKSQRLAQILRINIKSKEWGYVQILRTFFLYVVGLIPILSGGLGSSLVLVRQMLSTFNPWIFWDQSLYNYGLDRSNFMVAILSITFLLYVETLQTRMKVRQAIAARHIVIRWSIYFVGIFAVIIFGIYGPGYDASAFIYQGF